MRHEKLSTADMGEPTQGGGWSAASVAPVRDRWLLRHRLTPIVLSLSCLAVLGIAGCTAAATGAATGVAGDRVRGAQLYDRRCADCHDPDADSNGPRHRGVYGRRAGSVPSYHYSKALARSTIVWNDASLDAWLTDPQALVPGQRMKMRVSNPRDRADLIAYLKTLTP